MVRLLALSVVLVLAGSTPAADVRPVERTIGKEPAYKTKAPRYLLLAFGAEGKDRVWLVQDGDTLFVDRNGNGDLTDPGDSVAAKKPREGVAPEEGEFTFEVGELTVGGRTHKRLQVFVSPLAQFAGTAIGEHLDAKAALAKNPKATVAMLRLDVDVPELKGGGIGGRVSFTVGHDDNNGVLRFAEKHAAAPVVYLGGPLVVTFFRAPPVLRVGRATEFVLVVGTPGVGPGTFAMVQYADTIPDAAHPVAEVAFPPARAGAAPVKARHELKERC